MTKVYITESGYKLNVASTLRMTASEAETLLDGVFEPVLGNPGTNGYVLSSTTAGVRSWVAQSGGGGGGDVDTITTTTGSSTNMLRVAAAGGLEYRTTAQVLSDIGAAPTASPTFTGTVTLPTTVASVIKPASDSTTALRLANAAGTPVLTVDTTNNRIGVNYTPIVSFQVSGSSDEIVRFGGSSPTVRVFQTGRCFSINNGNVGGALSVTRIANTYIATFYDNATQRSYISADGTQTWNLSTAGRIQFSTPASYPGISIYTGATFDQDRFDILNNGTLFNFGFNVDGSNTVSVAPGGYTGFGGIMPAARVDIAASTTSAASLRIRSGTAPTSPNDGDIWYDGSNLKIRIGATTYNVDVTAV